MRGIGVSVVRIGNFSLGFIIIGPIAYCFCLSESHVDIIEFLLDNGADINKQGLNRFSPLYCAIRANRFKSCELILEYEQVSNQNMESGITMSLYAKVPLIQALLEKELKKRRKVILV
jgi:ankyrin repeat protein